MKTIEDPFSQKSTLDVAKLFGRQHGKVLRTIRAMECDPVFFKQNFEETTYQDGMGRKLPMFKVTRPGFNFLIMNFAGKKARAIRAALVMNSTAFFSQNQPEELNQISRNS